MNEPTPPPAPAPKAKPGPKPAAPKPPAPVGAPAFEAPETIAVKSLTFRGGVDLPCEQQQMRITTKERQDRPRYEIAFVPRIRMYRVRAFLPREKEPTHVFLIPADWAIADLEMA